MKKSISQLKELGVGFEVPKPTWDDLEFLTTPALWHAFKEYQYGGKSCIHLNSLEMFLDEILAEGRKRNVSNEKLQQYKRDYTFYLENKKENFISLRTILESLRILEFSILKRFRGRKNYTLQDIIKIWTHYDTKLTGYMAFEDVEAFAFDLVIGLDQKCDVNVIRDFARKLIVTSGSGAEGEEERLTFEGMTRLFPTAGNVLEPFPERKNILREDLEKGFSYYDQYGNDTVAESEIDEILKDLLHNLNMDESAENVMRIHNALVATLVGDDNHKYKRAEIALLLSH